jgi:hypothetical protein
MLRVDLKRLGKNREEAFEYLQSHLAEHPSLKEDHAELVSTKVREPRPFFTSTCIMPV